MTKYNIMVEETLERWSNLVYPHAFFLACLVAVVGISVIGTWPHKKQVLEEHNNSYFVDNVAPYPRM